MNAPGCATLLRQLETVEKPRLLGAGLSMEQV